MTDGRRLSGEWTPLRQAMAYQQALDSVLRARQTVVEFADCGYRARDKALRAAAAIAINTPTRTAELFTIGRAHIRGPLRPKHSPPPNTSPGHPPPHVGK